MVRPEVVDYLRQHLTSFKVEDLREQLACEGVSDDDFQDSLDAALKAAARKPVKRGAAGLLSLRRASVPAAPPSGPDAPAGQAAAFVGHSGYVVRLPAGYKAVSSFRDRGQQDEVVHFCRQETDPSSLIDEGLFGPLGI